MFTISLLDVYTFFLQQELCALDRIISFQLVFIVASLFHDLAINQLAILQNEFAVIGQRYRKYKFSSGRKRGKKIKEHKKGL